MRLQLASWLLTSFTTHAYALQCAAPPLNLPIRSLSTAPGTLSRGIPVSIGTPPQQIVLTPSLQLDTSFIPRYSNSCIYTRDSAIPANDTRWSKEDGRTVCASIYGGGFVPSLSTSFHDNGTDEQVVEEWFKVSRVSGWRFVTESFIFVDYMETYMQQNKILPEKRNVTSSFILPEEGATFGGLGGSTLTLTPNSRTLNTLYSEGLVPSRSWSLTNKGLCLGCIDESLSTGEFQSFKLAARDADGELPCLFQVEVEGLEYYPDVGTGGVALIDKPFTACVDPGVAFLVLPTAANARLSQAAVANLEAASNKSMPFGGSLKDGSGHLLLKLEGGLEVNITVPAARMTDGEGPGERTLAVTTGSWGAYGDAVPVLGRPFTDSVVLRWDEIGQEYGMANRNPQTDAKQSLNPLGCDEFPSSKPAETSHSSGIIVGSIIGGFAAGLLFASAAAFFFWRGQRGVRSKYEAMRGEDSVSLRTVDTGGRTLESRMSGTLSAPATSIRESLRSHFGTQSVSPMVEPHLVDDSQIYEAPEEGATYPLGRDRAEMRVYSYSDRWGR
ncbi:hypothetical protein ST47_g9805 [Ascochyta rabiei]|uniref:Uncharacterized protein n=1 Tax=Didymella rabiei TaxID=5454 RepID=A0A162WIZ9_DIDRA|nr:hypothetical protein ST47_g9805 [Ascochyta rabiei]